MGYCKHEWHETTGVLREVFNLSEGRHHAFYVCSRCLKIDEVADQVPAEQPVVTPRAGDVAA